MRVIKKVGRGFARLPMPAPATVIAMIALLVATGGTAWGVESATKKAAAPCPTNPSISKSSSKCHFPSWNSLDIINNSLKGIDVKNGSLAANDFSGGARAALRGNRGPTGPVGARGANGANGANGIVRLIYRNSGSLTNTKGAVQYGYVGCDAGYYAIGGGVDTDNGAQLINASYPGNSGGTPSSAGWVSWIYNSDTTTDHHATIWVICAQASSVGKTGFAGAAKTSRPTAQAMKEQ